MVMLVLISGMVTMLTHLMYKFLEIAVIITPVQLQVLIVFILPMTQRRLQDLQLKQRVVRLLAMEQSLCHILVQQFRLGQMQVQQIGRQWKRQEVYDLTEHSFVLKSPVWHLIYLLGLELLTAQVIFLSKVSLKHRHLIHMGTHIWQLLQMEDALLIK